MRSAVTGLWIRGPLWDGFFVLSGLPLGLALLCLTGPWYDWPNPHHYGHSLALLLIFTAVVFLELGHSLSPILLAWSHAGFRRMMLECKIKYIGLPTVIFAVCAGVGVATGLGLTTFRPRPHPTFTITDWGNPLPILMWFYTLWNAYHFGMQNFGVLSIYRKNREQREVSGNSSLQPPGQARGQPRGQRRIDKSFCLTVTCTAMATAFPIGWVHLPWTQYFWITLSLSATMAMLMREARVYRSLPRAVFILADGLALALIWWQPIIGVAIYTLNHWLVAIGLSGHVFANSFDKTVSYSVGCVKAGTKPQRSLFNPFAYFLVRHGFILVMLALGSVGFLFLTPDPTGNDLSVGPALRWLFPMSVSTMWVLFPILVCSRLGNGIVHFLYDRWVWKMSDPRVQATIGRDLFKPAWGTIAPSS